VYYNVETTINKVYDGDDVFCNHISEVSHEVITVSAIPSHGPDKEQEDRNRGGGPRRRSPGPYFRWDGTSAKFMLHNTSDIAFAKQSQEQFNFTLPSVALERRRTKFMHKLCCVDFFTQSGRSIHVINQSINQNTFL